MTKLLLSICLCLGALPAFAQADTPSVPAPLIGAGIPVALALGGVLLGSKLVRRLRK